MKEEYKALFEKLAVNQLQLNNRYVVAPMTRISAENNGIANETMKAYYERYAKGGFGTIITEGVYPDEEYSQGYHNQPGLANVNQMKSWKPIVEGVHKHGAAFIAQLMHAGSQSQGNIHANDTIAPSAVPPQGDMVPLYGGEGPYPTPIEMTHANMEQVKQGFVTAAINAREAGFDGVEIHGANGYLLDEFLTDYMNLREDQYGGATGNRVRFLTEIIIEVRKAVGREFIVGIRISQGKVSDGEHRWALGESDAKTIFSSLDSTPLDYIHVTDADGTKPSFGEGSKSIAAAAKQYSRLPIMANGQLQDPAIANSLLQEDQADLISLATSALQNPDLPNRVKQDAEVVPFDFKSIMLPKAYIKEHELKMEIM
ncbi:NADH:flavin oxidoreductase [Halobacillus shinanisalinarum]|uniref:NADH:flavin oxidoreductase n=1 Tax=Halobacillus shinanisalinarum TaxID=2932258 RepID=A0ABY4GXA7_9BACI|nr:NADH:flavin oxidoreductase [Halobacillus shinanisalinarum]UOQ92565.1 NADH:flavin oxidoreductase [Halobacillus shinanisalinarum]